MMGMQELMEIGRERELVPVQCFVNQRLLGKLVNVYDVPEHAAAKALYFTGNESIERAIDWVERNQNVSDFNKPMNVSRLNQFMGRFDQFGGFPRQVKKKQPTKEMKEFEKDLPKLINKWQVRLEYKGETQLLEELCDMKTQEETLEDLLGKKLTDEWKKEEEKMLTVVEYKQGKDYLTELKRLQSKRKEKVDLFNEVIEMFNESDIDLSDEESDKDKAISCIDAIYGLSEDKQKVCLDAIRKILIGLLNEPEKYKEVSEEEFKNNVMGIKDTMQLLEIIGYTSCENKLIINHINKDLVKEVVEFIDK